MTPEQEVKQQICEWLNLAGAEFTLHVRGRGKYKSKWMKPGWPDIHGVWTDSKALLIEVKAPGGTASQDQIRVIERAKALGAHAMFAYSLDDVIDYFRKVKSLACHMKGIIG
jgi:hypothetical protein